MDVQLPSLQKVIRRSGPADRPAVRRATVDVAQLPHEAGGARRSACGSTPSSSLARVGESTLAAPPAAAPARKIVRRKTLFSPRRGTLESNVSTPQGPTRKLSELSTGSATTAEPGSVAGTPSHSNRSSRRTSTKSSVAAEEALRWPSGQQSQGDEVPDYVRSAQLYYLNRKHGFAVAEVKHILEQFDLVAGRSGGKIDFGGFRDVLRGIFERDDLAAKGVLDAWEASKPKDAVKGAKLGEVDIDGFLGWYAAEQVWATLEVATTWEVSQETLERLAQQHCVPLSVIEGVAQVFQQGDADRSGVLEYSEFRSVVLGLPGADREEDRIRRMWQEMDRQGKGLVEFPEFTQWYLERFRPEAEGLRGEN